MSALFYLLAFSLFCCQTSRGAPGFSLSASDVTAVYGSTVVLNCTATADENLLPANVSLDELTLTIESTSGELASRYHENETVFVEIHQVDITDRGNYTCTAELGNYTLSTVFRLTVNQFALTVVEPLINVTIPLGGTGQLVCTFNHNLDYIFWTKDFVTFNSDRSGRINITSFGNQTWLTISNVSFNDMAIYRCHGIVLEFATSAETYLRIQEYVPLHVNNSRYAVYQVVNNSVTEEIRCDITGVPRPIYIWKRENELITNVTSDNGPYVADNGSLIISSATPTNSGNYTCYGIHQLNIETNISLSYNITILSAEDQVNSIDWFITGLVLIIAITLLFLCAICLYFIIANTDICVSEKRRMRMMQKKLKKQLKSHEVADDEFGFYAPTSTHAGYNDDDLIDDELSELTSDASEQQDVEEEEDIDGENESFQGTFMRKSTPPTRPKKIKNLFKRFSKRGRSSSSKQDTSNQHLSEEEKMPTVVVNPIVPLQETPTSSSAASEEDDEEMVQTTTAPKKQEPVEEVPMQGDGMYYMETLYTPPPVFDDDDDDDDFVEEELTKNLIPAARQETPPPPALTTTVPAAVTSNQLPEPVTIEREDDDEPLSAAENGSSTQMASESLTIQMEATVVDSDSEEESSYDLEKIMAQHTTNESESWPWKQTTFSEAAKVTLPSVTEPLLLQTMTEKENDSRRKSVTIDEDNLPSADKVPAKKKVSTVKKLTENAEDKDGDEIGNTSLPKKRKDSLDSSLSRKRKTTVDSSSLKRQKKQSVDSSSLKRQRRKSLDPSSLARQINITDRRRRSSDPTEREYEAERREEIKAKVEPKKEAKKKEKLSKKPKKKDSYASADVFY